MTATSNPVHKGDIVAIIESHSSTGAFGSGLGCSSYQTFTLGNVESASRDGIARKVQLGGNGYTSDVERNHLTVMHISPDKQPAALRVFEQISAMESFETVDALKAAILAAVDAIAAENNPSVPHADVCQETAYGSTVRLPFQVRVF